MCVHLVDEVMDVLGRGVLADAVSEVEYVADAGRAGVQMRRAEGLQHTARLGADRRGWSEQDVGIDVAL